MPQRRLASSENDAWVSILPAEFSSLTRSLDARGADFPVMHRGSGGSGQAWARGRVLRDFLELVMGLAREYGRVPVEPCKEARL